MNKRVSPSDMEKQIVILGFLTWGFTMLMRTAFGYFIEDLSLSPSQIGISNAVSSIMICFSALAIGSAIERTGNYFLTLAVSLLIGAAAVLILTNATDFAMIVISRALLGIGCGPLFTLTMKSVALSSTDFSYPRNAGIVSNGEAIINTILGPVILVVLLNRLGFIKTNFLFAGLLVLMAGLWFLIGRRLETFQTAGKSFDDSRSMRLIKNRLLMMCIMAGSLALVACWCIYMYVPLLLQTFGGLSNTHMSFVMAAMGVFMSGWMVVLPAVYTTRKDKLVVAAGCLLGALGIGALMLKPESWVSILLFILFGGLASVVSLFFMAIFSVENVQAHQTAAALALTNGGCELLGASIGPMIAGWVADKTNIKMSMMISSASLTCAALITLIIHVKSKSKGE